PPTLRILPLKGYGKDAQQVASLLWRAFGLRGSRRGEMALALSAFGRTPGEDLSAPRIQLDPGMKGAVAAKTIHCALLSIIQANEPGLIQDLDSEFLHDFRVAIRKTRSALGQVKGVFPPRKLAHFEREFRWLGGRTGPTRDMDVYLLKIPSYQAALPGGVKDQLEPLVRFLERKKKLEHGRLVRTLRTERYARLIEDWTRFLSEPVPEGGESPNAHRPIIELASERIWKAYWKVLTGGEAAGEDAPAEALHRLRIDCKKLRYLLTFFQSLFPPKEMRSLINELKLLQDVLGDFNDIHVQRESLRRFADEMMETGVGPPETLMAMGRLMGQLETQQEIERGAFHERFRRFARGRNVSRFQ
ncbi:MAG: CHAD domain-containing protein, partial [Gemmatimonadetes bacterium]|nr:CHAD domain-containing protein [Gemmatimonadota bacterium]